MPALDPNKLYYVWRNLPWRMPRGSVENVVRMFMFWPLYQGLNRAEAERMAIDKARALGWSVENLSLQYYKE
jgi:hypothetical protein